MPFDIPMPPTHPTVIQRVYPDLHAREVARERPSWARLRRMVASRWWRTHPTSWLALRYQREADTFRAEFTCIGRWEAHNQPNTNTGNGYYGELQMDLSFQRTYGPELLARKGTANNWTRDEQYAVGARAVLSGRGFHPWPNTARFCGLI